MTNFYRTYIRADSHKDGTAGLSLWCLRCSPKVEIPHAESGLGLDDVLPFDHLVEVAEAHRRVFHSKAPSSTCESFYINYGATTPVHCRSNDGLLVWEDPEGDRITLCRHHHWQAKTPASIWTLVEEPA